MNEILMVLASNALLATGMLVIGLTADRFFRWPAVRHLVWAAVLLQLLLPPIVVVDLPLPDAVPEATGATKPAARSSETVATMTGSPLEPSRQSIAVTPAAVLLAIELAGVGLFLGLALIRSQRLSGTLRSTEEPPEQLTQRARELADAIGLGKLPRIRITNERVVPMLVALPWPTIVLSRPLIDSLGARHIDALLAHELAHARRGDAWLRPIELVATALYWWLPTVWIARRRLRQAEEAACDALVLGSQRTTRRTYAESLLRTIELTTPSAAATFANGSTNGRQLKERITMILKHSDDNAPRGVLVTAAALAALAILVSPGWAPAQPADDPSESADAGPSESNASGITIERALIETRLRAYTIENQIQRVEVSHELARMAEGLEAAQANGLPREANEMRRSIERLELEAARLDVNMEIHQLETELALRALELHAAGSGAPVPVTAGTAGDPPPPDP